MFDSIKSLVTDATIKPKAKPKAEPFKIDGTEIPEEVYRRQPGDFAVAVLVNGEKDSPYYGRRCAVRFCRETPSWTLRPGGVKGNFEAPELPQLRNTDPLAARLEAAMQHRMAGVIVPEVEEIVVCDKHRQAYEREALARQEAKRAEAEANAPWQPHLASLDYEGARIEFIDGTWFRLVLADGRSIKLEVVMHLAEVTARVNHGAYRTEVLDGAAREEFKRKVEMGEIASTLSPSAILDAKVSDITRN